MALAIRRHHAARLRRKRKDYTARHWDTPCPCSCWMCCNPRRSDCNPSERITIGERRFYCVEERENV